MHTTALNRASGRSLATKFDQPFVLCPRLPPPTSALASREEEIRHSLRRLEKRNDVTLTLGGKTMVREKNRAVKELEEGSRGKQFPSRRIQSGKAIRTYNSFATPSKACGPFRVAGRQIQTEIKTACCFGDFVSTRAGCASSKLSVETRSKYVHRLLSREKGRGSDG